jgi:hypothetical protein
LITKVNAAISSKITITANNNITHGRGEPLMVRLILSSCPKHLKEDAVNKNDNSNVLFLQLSIQQP